MKTPDGVEVQHEPHYRYPDWPGTTTLYLREGVATIQNDTDGSYLFLRIAGDEHGARACLKLEETEFLYEQLGFALEEQRQLVQKERELDEAIPIVVPDMD